MQVLDYPAPRRPSELCSITFLRYALFSFNTILLMTGLTLLGFSIWTVLEKMDIALLVQPTYSITVYGMVAVGALVLLTSILGCQGTVQEHRCSLLLFSVLLVLILLSEATIGVMSYLVFTNMSRVSFSSQLYTTFTERWMNDEARTAAIDNIQIKYACCGSEHFTEWRSNPVILERNTTVPDSCCISPTKDCGRLNHLSNINERGCARLLEEGVRLNIVLMPALALGFSVLQIFGVIFSCALAHQIRRGKRRVRRRYTY